MTKIKRIMSTTMGQKTQATLDRILYEVDIASNLYLGYTIFMIWVTAPFMLYQSPLSTRAKKGFCLQSSSIYCICLVGMVSI
eukprot:UN13819